MKENEWLWKSVTFLLFILAVMVAIILHPLVGVMYETIDMLGLSMFFVLMGMVLFSLLFGEDRHLAREAPMPMVAMIAILLLLGPLFLPEISKETAFFLLKIGFGCAIVAGALIFCSFFPSFEEKRGEGIKVKPKPVT